MSVPTLNPAGYSQVVECRHSLLRQAMLSHQSRPRPMGLNADSVARTSGLPKRNAGTHKQRNQASAPTTRTTGLSIDEFRTILRSGCQTLLILAVVTTITLGVDLLLTIT